MLHNPPESPPVTRSREIYRELCNSDPAIPIYGQAWWLDAIAGPEGWDAILVTSKESVVASMPYCLRRRRFGLQVALPPLTQTNGLVVRYPQSQKISKRLEFEKRVLGEIVAQLDALQLKSYAQNFPPTLTNWLPFYWSGFQCSPRYTYVIPDLSDLEAVWEGMATLPRRKIKSAQRVCTVEEITLAEFRVLNDMTFARQNLALPYSWGVVEALDEACVKRDARVILGARDASGRLHAGAYVVWDARSAYHIMSGGDPDLRGSGAGSLIIWEAMCRLSGQVQRYDFEGSMIEPIEQHFRSYGATQEQYFSIRKESMPLSLLRLLARRPLAA